MTRSNVLAPGFLVASPRLDGSLFERSVIVMVHHDAQGAMGFIVNKPLEVDFGSLLELVDLDSDQIAPQCYEQDVFFGGPVRVEQLWVIYEGRLKQDDSGVRSLHDDGEVRFHDDFTLSGTSASIESFAFGQDDNPFHPFVGYAGWGPGQLEDEIGDGSWLMIDFDPNIIACDPHQMWALALETLGVDETTFAMMGKAGSA